MNVFFFKKKKKEGVSNKSSKKYSFYWKYNYGIRSLNSIFSTTKMDDYYMNSILGFFLNFILLGYIGGQEITIYYIIFGQICSLLFFFIFINF